MELLRPVTVRQALEALEEHPDALLLAGGTDVMVDINLHGARPRVVIALKRIDQLRRQDAGFIGAGVTYSALLRSPHRALAEASRTVGSPQIRAAGTIGGNLGTASPAGDALPFLVAADATVVLASTDSTRQVPIGQFLTGPKQNARRPGELILGVELPGSTPGAQAFSKVGTRQAMVIAIANVCVLRAEAGETRVAIGAVGPRVVRATEAEALVSSTALDEPTLEEFQRLVRAAAHPITDHRATARYRRHAVGVIARRALQRVVAA